MKTLLVIPLLLSSCVYATKDRMVSLGGASAYKSAGFGLVHDHNDSFRAGAATVGIVAGLAAGAWQHAATETTTRAINSNATGVQKAAIQADVIKSTTLNPNIIPKDPNVIPVPAQ